MSFRAEVDRERRERVGLDLAKLARPEWPQLGLRFAFGAGIAVAAGLAGLRWGPRVGGVFLAFPAILPAALTLLERSDGVEKTETDALGAGLGALAMLIFALVVAHWGAPLGVVAVPLAAVAWGATALLLFAAGRAVLVRPARRR